MRLELFSITPPRNIRTYLFFAFSALLLGLFIFSNVLLGRLAQQTERTSHVFAQFCATASFPAAQDTVYEEFVTELIQSINFPIVLTDAQGIPRAWKGIGVDPLSVPALALDSLAFGLDPAPVYVKRIDDVKKAAERLDRSHEPIPLLEPQLKLEIGLVHWGQPRVLSLLRYVPYVSVGIFGILLFLTFWGARGIRLAEARSIWVGLAKETAHQLGTPLSSLMGWVELLRGKLGNPGSDEPVTIDREFLTHTVDEMAHDLHRLNQVAARFSQIGSVPDLTSQDLVPVIHESIRYMQRRMPHLGRQVHIEEMYEENVPAVRANSELLQWVMENLMVNSLNALEGNEGLIQVRLAKNPEGNDVEVEVTDNGRGMTPEVQKRCFETGFSTRKRGWGLGLPIARRIIEDYHGGKIFIRASAPGNGTTFVLSFPT